MPGGGTCTLRRLFHSPGTIGFYSPEPLKADRQEPGYTKLRGWRYALKTQKPVPLPYNLHILTRDCMLFAVSGAQLKFFRAKTPPEEAVGMVGTEVGALSQLKLEKIVSLTFHMHSRFANRKVLRAMGLLQKFLGKNPIRKHIRGQFRSMKKGRKP